jgi:hypothetical protein
MKTAKILLGSMLVLFAVIIGFISFLGLFLYLGIMGYIIAFFYLVNNNKYFSEFYRQLYNSYGESAAISHIFSPWMLGAFLYGILTLPLDNSRFSRLEFFLLAIAAITIYFLIIFLPAIIRTKRKFR